MTIFLRVEIKNYETNEEKVVKLPFVNNWVCQKTSKGYLLAELRGENTFVAAFLDEIPPHHPRLMHYDSVRVLIHPVDDDSYQSVWDEFDDVRIGARLVSN